MNRFFRKSNDRQNFLHVKLEHPYSLKKGIPYSEAVQIRRICSTFQHYLRHSRKFIEQFFDKGYRKDVVLQQIQKVDQFDRKQLLHQQKPHYKQCIPLSITLLHITGKSELKKKKLSMLPIIAFRKDIILKQIISTNTIHNNKKLLKTKNNHHTGKYVPCNSTR